MLTGVIFLLQISVAQALLGGTVRIQGLYEDHTIQVSEIFLLLFNKDLVMSMSNSGCFSRTHSH